ncbi:putative ABC multidrug transporter [Rhexocercosporidium sp. MPI-PUGE-AT-0058]|nr:putative ABC multidrug transporter [Rhexocercosporidium sp. MPI-PUGE-AT-0058]
MSFSTGEGGLLQLNQTGFDFSLQFEQLFFSIIPSALFIVISIWRTIPQARKPIVVHAPLLKLIKLGAIATYVSLELALLILVAVGPFNVTKVFIASSVLKMASALLMMMLSVVDHSKSPRPSIILSVYLFFTLLLDSVQVRTLFLSSTKRPEFSYSSVFSATIALKVGILLLEAQRKTKWVSWNQKEHSPEETSGIFSLSLFFWLNRVFWDGYKKILSVKDLYPLDSSLSAQLLHERFAKNTSYTRLKGKRLGKFGLLKVLVTTLRVPLLLPILPRLALLGFTFCQPFFINTLLEHLSQPEIDANVGYGFIGASVLIYSGIAVSTALYWYFHLRMLTMARSILVTEIFIHATEARIEARDDTATLTLMSTDIERINSGFRSLHEFWASFIQVAIASWMLYNQLGVVFIVPIVVVTICIVVLAILMSLTGDSQRAWMAGVQKRVGLTATVITRMKNLKASGLSTVIGGFVQHLRVEELAKGNRFRKIEVCAAVMAFTPLMIGPPLTFAFAQRALDAARIFTSLSYLMLLTNPLSLIFQVLPGFMSGLACLGRIQAFLECEARHDFRLLAPDTRDNLSGSEAAPMTHITITEGNFGWEANKFVLHDINVVFPKSSLTVVVGPVASGKSTLCKALLGEVPVSKGKLALDTGLSRIGFCDQTPFLLNKSIRDNIVGFSPFDVERYDEVIKATALDFDIDTMGLGDNVIGSAGITLSGGQKQRVSLARALYLQTDLLILDDIFSGLDADTENQIFRQVFGPDGLLKRRLSTVVLCTHSIRHLPSADHIVALGGGFIVEQGTFDELMTHQGYVKSLAFRGPSNSDLSSEEMAANNSMPKSEPKLLRALAAVSSIGPDSNPSRQLGDRTVYMHYFKSAGLLLAVSSLLCAALFGFCMSFPTIWLKYWSDNAYSKHPAHSYAFYAGIYSFLQVGAMVWLGLLGVLLFIISVPRVGASLHQEALQTLLRAPPRFFTKTDTGIVINLFSQDLNLIDTELPEALLNTLYAVFTAIGQAAVMLSSSPYIAISYPFLLALMWILQRFYLRTSRQLRLLDLEAKSPLYTHFLDTVKGITTLRAFGFVPNDIKKNASLINFSQRPAYLLFMIQQWLTLVLNMVVMVLATVLTSLAVKIQTNSGFTGASLVTLMGFGNILSGIVMFYTTLETSIGAIARLKTFNETVKPEDKDEEDNIPAEDWPQKGVIELKDVSASYDTENQVDGAPDLALRDIDLTINGGEKVAICGRTGSGKSSVIALLLKLLEPLPGIAATAMIDNIPLDRIERSTLRERIIVVPQEAVFLPEGSTFQENLDPFHAATAEECKNILKVMDSWSFVEKRGGLEAEMGADTLSQGQQQLISLGRALLKRRIRARIPGANGGILLLDEVSSSVDDKTERIMQEIIRSDFKDYTVVAISHRLEMIMDFDRVIVMDSGKIVEDGNPKILAAEGTATRFGELVRAGAL